jgi:hypothetical protein
VLVFAFCGCGKKKPSAFDLSTPQAAAMTFVRAIEAGDADTARRAAIAGGIEWDMVDALAHATTGMRKLRASATRRFGETETKRVIDPRSPLDLSQRLKDADVASDGNVATITPKDGQNPLKLKNVDGEWKVDVGALTRGQDITRAAPLFHAVGVAATEAAAELDAGKYQSVRELQDALQSKMFAAMREGGATTTPSAATMPTGLP